MDKNTEIIRIKVFLFCNYYALPIMKMAHLVKQVLLSVLLISLTGCSKDEVDEAKDRTHVTITLKTSNQISHSIYLDIQDIQIKVKTDNAPVANWLSLHTINQGVCNASELNEDATLLLVDDFEIEAYYLHEIRLVLGDNNFIDINNVLHSLEVSTFGNAKPSNVIETQLKSKRRYDMVIDIDLDKSISYNQEENMRVLTPKLYTAIRQIEY